MTVKTNDYSNNNNYDNNNYYNNKRQNKPYNNNNQNKYRGGNDYSNNGNNNTNSYYYPTKTYHNSNYHNNNNNTNQHKIQQQQQQPQYFIASTAVSAVAPSATSQASALVTQPSFVPIYFDSSNPNAHHPAQFSTYYNGQITATAMYPYTSYEPANGGYYCAPAVMPIQIPISTTTAIPTQTIAPQLITSVAPLPSQPQHVEPHQQIEQQQPQQQIIDNNNQSDNNFNNNKHNAQPVRRIFKKILLTIILN